jgi:hypothetical protein
MMLTKVPSQSVYFLEEVPQKQGYSCPYSAHRSGCYSLCPLFRHSEATDPDHKPVPKGEPTHLRLTLECSPNGRIFLGDLLIHQVMEAEL